MRKVEENVKYFQNDLYKYSVWIKSDLEVEPCRRTRPNPDRYSAPHQELSFIELGAEVSSWAENGAADVDRKWSKGTANNQCNTPWRSSIT